MTRGRRWTTAALAGGLAAAGLAALAAPAALPAQEYFGTNHVQYDRFDWKVLETEHFQVYYYAGLEQTARIAGSMGERTYARLSRVLGHQFREKKPIVVYGSRTDYAQNNIFGDPGEGVGGVTDWLRQRNTLYFIGDYGEFDHILAHEMVHVFQYDIFSRGRAGANFQTFARTQPPLWYMEGMAEYLSLGPGHVNTQAVMRDAALNGRIPSIEAMTRRPDLFFPYRFGTSLWEYIGRRWGDQVIGDIMNGVPGVGIERAFRRELGMSLEQLGDEWRESVQVEQLPQVADRQRARRVAEPLLNVERTGGASGSYVAPALSPDGTQVAFLSSGSYLRGEVFPDLYLADTETGKRVARLTKSTTNAQFEELRIGYSQAAFSPDGRQLAFTTQRRGKDILVLLDVRRRRQVRSFEHLPFEQMIGPSYSPDGQRIAFIGVTGEQSDVFIVNADGTGLRQITDDLYGDAQTAWSPDGRYLAWASERGPQSDLATLRFGKWRLSLHDLETGTTEVLPGQDGRNLNPQWSPDSRSIAYISDRTGIANIFLYELAEREHYQLTDLFGAVTSFTEISPALSWARQADRLAFVHYENGDYSVWSTNNPRRLKTTPFRDAPAAPVVAAATPAAGVADSAVVVAVADSAVVVAVADSAVVVAAADSAGVPPTPADSAVVAAAPADSASAPPPSVLLVASPERLSVYRAAVGLRPADTLVAGERFLGDGVTVAALLDSASLALPDTSTFRVYDYKAGFRPEMISQPQIGYGQDNYFGRQLFGATTVILSDMLGNHRLAIAGAINGQISDAQLFVGYTNFARRLQYSVGVSQLPYAFYAGSEALPLSDGTLQVDHAYQRLIWREAFGTAIFPRNRFRRWEFGSRFLNVDREHYVVQRLLDNAGFDLVQPGIVRQPGGGSVSALAPFAAYVGDNALVGYTAPIYGSRFRLQVSPYVGSWDFVEYLADYRRYDPILFNVLTLATRLTTQLRVGPDEAGFAPQVLWPQQMRGYEREFFDGRSCAGVDESRCVSWEELSGSRTALASAELRFPMVRRFDLGLLPISLPPVDGHLFYDAGVAWSRDQTVRFGSRQGPDPDERSILTSWGAGFRLNLFGFAIMRVDYVIPLATPERQGHWTWLLGGYGF